MYKFKISVKEAMVKDTEYSLGKENLMGEDVICVRDANNNLIGTIPESTDWMVVSLYANLTSTITCKATGEDSIEVGNIPMSYIFRLGGLSTPAKIAFFTNCEPGNTEVTICKGEEQIVAKDENDIIIGKLEEKDAEYFNNLLKTEAEITAKVFKKGRTAASLRLSYQVETPKAPRKSKMASAETTPKPLTSVQSTGSFLPDCAQRIIEVMEQVYMLPSQLVTAVKNRWTEYDEEGMNRIPKEPEVMFNDDADIVRPALLAAMNGSGLMLIGPAAAGKNTLIKTIAWILQQPYLDVAITADHSKEDYCGGQVVETTVENGLAIQNIKFKPDELLLALEKGYFLNLDEINFGDSRVLTFLNGLMDFRGSAYISGYKTVQRNPMSIVTATGNVGSAYVGTRSLNLALKSRFMIMRMDPIDDITNLLKPQAQKKSYAIALGKVYKTFRKALMNNDQNADEAFVMPRSYEAALMLLNWGESFEKAVEFAIINQSDSENVRKVAMNLVSEMQIQL